MHVCVLPSGGVTSILSSLNKLSRLHQCDKYSCFIGCIATDFRDHLSVAMAPRSGQMFP